MNTNDFYTRTLRNFIEFTSTTATNLQRCTNGVLKKDGVAIWLNTQSSYPLFNGYFNFGTQPIDYLALIPKAKKHFGATPFTIWIDSDTAQLSHELKEQLQAEKIHSAGEYKGVELDLQQVNDLPMPASCDLIPITTQNEFEQYCHIINTVFELPQPIAEDFKNMLAPSDVYDPYTNYLAYYQGKPVATLTSFISGNIVGLYCGATLTEFRKKGLSSALAMKALQDAKEKGCDTSVVQLMAKNMAGGITSKLGFKTVCQFTPYVYGFDTDALEK